MAEQARFTGQTYGEGARQQASQRMVPTGQSPTSGVELGALNRPTESPNEPITAGIAMGAGPGPGAVPAIGVQPGGRDDLIMKMRAMVSKYPNSALIALLEHMENS